MKKISSLFVFLIAFACVETDNYDIPKSGSIIESQVKGTEISINSVKNNYNQETAEIYTFSGDMYFVGYVISSDKAGNFYNKLILQDAPENSQSGIQILVDENALFETYDLGRKLIIRLEGLSLWKNNGVFQLGKQNRGDVVAITPSEIDRFILRTQTISKLEPKLIDIGDFSQAILNTYVKLERVQFNRTIVRESYTFAGESFDQYDAVRQIESCQTTEISFVGTSTYADFKSIAVPDGTGSIEGVLTRNYYDDYYVLKVNSLSAMKFNAERCDPDFFECSETAVEGDYILFSENFAEITNEKKLDELGWMNRNINEGEERFVDATSNGNRTIRISGYNTGENPLEVWLVTPNIDLSKSGGEMLSFDIKASYDNGSILKVYISEDFSGNPKNANWKLLKASIPIGPTNQNGAGFTHSEIDISCLQDSVAVGFYYLGRDPDKTTTYDIDNIRINAREIISE
ncbi:DUF5689 domain-containing protein [Zunongwangia sp.]|uniref:DUF5689 domain-containing protein n=1 Tax=Zunongwangia sp. TaxID=1965325 RepID=UPI003AA8E5CB